MKRLSITIFALAALLSGGAAAAKDYTHQEYFEHYEGTSTCLECHQKEAETFFMSQHYQWQGETPDLVNTDGEKFGKINTINDFCTNPAANWIGLTRNSRGEVITKGCSSCHAGLGKLPSPVMSTEQLENIDCLMCHASGYRRDLYMDEAGGLAWKPILWKNQEGLDSVSKRITLPERSMCLRCHSASGGGPNFKRGDIEYALADTDCSFDVHMGTDGGDMQCVACHAGEDHRVRGRGVDLAGTDSPANRLTCDGECHGAAPHQTEVLDYHTKRVACTTCHIPTYAKEDATDMVRDWSTPHYNEEGDRWSATITTEKNVTPVYAWYNGKTWAQLPGRPAERLDDGTIGMMVPQGSRFDPAAKIFAFKLHRAKLPVLDGKDWIIPIVVEKFFADGDIDGAVREAAHDTYGVEDAAYSWSETSRYMGLFHEVQPAEKALGCLSCHGSNGRLDWKALGYDRDPLLGRLQTSP